MIPQTYEQQLALDLNIEWAEITSIIEMADAVEIGIGKATVPRDWIDVLTDDPVERAKWLIRNLRKELKG